MWKRILAWFSRTPDSKQVSETSRHELTELSGKPQLLFQVEDVWNDNRTTGTHLHGEIHLRISIHQVAANSFRAEQAIETSGQALFLGFHLTSEDLSEILSDSSEVFYSLDEACRWVRDSDLIKQGKLLELFERALESYHSGRLPPSGTLTPWSGRCSKELFEIELPPEADNEMRELLQGFSTLDREIPRSLNDLRFLFDVEVVRYIERLGVSRDSLQDSAKSQLLPLIEARFIKLLSGQK